MADDGSRRTDCKGQINMVGSRRAAAHRHDTRGIRQPGNKDGRMNLPCLASFCLFVCLFVLVLCFSCDFCWLRVAAASEFVGHLPWWRCCEVTRDGTVARVPFCVVVRLGNCVCTAACAVRVSAVEPSNQSRKFETTTLGAMVIQTLFILNKSGGLIYQKDVSRKLPPNEGGRETRKKRMGMNEKMMAGSTFHGLSQIAASVSPEAGAFGIVRLMTSTYQLQCFETLTGM